MSPNTACRGQGCTQPQHIVVLTPETLGGRFMAIAPERMGIGIRRHFTTAGTHPYDEVKWERRDARITNFRDGTVAFEQLDVEIPATWSVNAMNIVAQK